MRADSIQTGCIFILAASVALLWYWFLFKAPSRSFIKVLVFPVFYFRNILSISENSAAIPIMLSYLILLSGVIELLLPSSPYCFITGWGAIMFWEAFALSAYLFKPQKTRTLILTMIGILLIISIGAIRTVQAQSYQIMNSFDFIGGIYLFSGSVYIIARIIIQGRFDAEVEPFFVFFGLIIYAFLHSLSTIMLAFDFMQNFDFASYATSITLLFWLVSVPWIRRLQSKLTS